MLNAAASTFFRFYESVPSEVLPLDRIATRQKTHCYIESFGSIRSVFWRRYLNDTAAVVLSGQRCFMRICKEMETSVYRK